MREGGPVGDNVAAFAEVLMRKRRHPEQSYRTCMGVIRLADKFGSDRVDAACKHALQINAYSYRSVHSILKTGIDKRPRSQCQEEPAITHPNIRGSQYFH